MISDTELCVLARSITEFYGISVAEHTTFLFREGRRYHRYYTPSMPDSGSEPRVLGYDLSDLTLASMEGQTPWGESPWSGSRSDLEVTLRAFALVVADLVRPPYPENAGPPVQLFYATKLIEKHLLTYMGFVDVITEHVEQAEWVLKKVGVVLQEGRLPQIPISKESLTKRVQEFVDQMTTIELALHKATFPAVQEAEGWIR